MTEGKVNVLEKILTDMFKGQVEYTAEKTGLSQELLTEMLMAIWKHTIEYDLSSMSYADQLRESNKYVKHLFETKYLDRLPVPFQEQIRKKKRVAAGRALLDLIRKQTSQ